MISRAALLNPELRSTSPTDGPLSLTAVGCLEPASSQSGVGSLSREERHCKLETCGAVLVRKEGESLKQLQRRQFCDRRCSAEWQRGRAPVHPLSFAGTYPRIKREWPAEERFDRPGMQIDEQPDWRRIGPAAARA